MYKEDPPSKQNYSALQHHSHADVPGCSLSDHPETSETLEDPSTSAVKGKVCFIACKPVPLCTNKAELGVGCFVPDLKGRDYISLSDWLSKALLCPYMCLQKICLHLSTEDVRSLRLTCSTLMQACARIPVTGRLTLPANSW